MTWGQTSVDVRADLGEVAAALWHFNSRMNYEISGDVERKVKTDGDGINSEGYFEATVERRQKLESKHFAHHHDRIFKSKVQMLRIGEKYRQDMNIIHQLLLLTLALTQMS